MSILKRKTPATFGHRTAPYEMPIRSSTRPGAIRLSDQFHATARAQADAQLPPEFAWALKHNAEQQAALCLPPPIRWSFQGLFRGEGTASNTSEVKANFTMQWKKLADSRRLPRSVNVVFFSPKEGDRVDPTLSSGYSPACMFTAFFELERGTAQGARISYRFVGMASTSWVCGAAHEDVPMVQIPIIPSEKPWFFTWMGYSAVRVKLDNYNYRVQERLKFLSLLHERIGPEDTRKLELLYLTAPHACVDDEASFVALAHAMHISNMEERHMETWRQAEIQLLNHRLAAHASHPVCFSGKSPAASIRLLAEWMDHKEEPCPILPQYDASLRSLIGARLNALHASMKETRDR
jgi:hypothetical protein